MKFRQLKPYDSFYFKNQLCFKISFDRYISPSGTYKLGDLDTEVKTKQYHKASLMEAYREYRT